MSNFYNSLYDEVEKAFKNGLLPIISDGYEDYELDTIAEELPSILAYGSNDALEELVSQDENLLRALFRYIVDEYATYMGTSYEPQYFRSIENMLSHTKTKALVSLETEKAQSIIDLYKSVKTEFIEC